MKYSKELINYIKSNLLDSINRPKSAIIRRDWFKNSKEYKQILTETEWVNKLNPNMTDSYRILLILKKYY